MNDTQKKRRTRPKWDRLQLLELYLEGVEYGRKHQEPGLSDVGDAIAHIEKKDALK